MGLTLINFIQDDTGLDWLWEMGQDATVNNARVFKYYTPHTYVGIGRLRGLTIGIMYFIE